MFARIGRRLDRPRAVAALLAICGGLMAALAAADEPAKTASPGAVAGSHEVGRRGFLYEVVRPATSGRPARRFFLYGTIHVGRAGDEPFNRPLVEALRCSARVALEADPSDAGAARRLALSLGLYGDADRLDAHLPAQLMARVKAWGAKNGMSVDRIETFRPWLLANLVELTKAGALGLDPDLGSEFHLARYARKAGLPIVEIEGFEAQLGLLADLPAELQVAELEEALADADGAQPQDDVRALFALWLAGDTAAGEALADAMHREARDNVFERYFVETVLDARNRTMADRAGGPVARVDPSR
jgi:uncharacterized protein